MGLNYLDSCLLVYLVERHPTFEPVVRDLIETEAGAFAISPLVKAECLTGAIKRGDMIAERAFHRAFSHFSTLEMDEAVFIKSALLRAGFGLTTPDALHLACALQHGCTALWTNDTRLSAAGGSLVRVLRA